MTKAEGQKRFDNWKRYQDCLRSKKNEQKIMAAVLIGAAVLLAVIVNLIHFIK